jgi:tetratricopeptide (TPR) repeat protein
LDPGNAEAYLAIGAANYLFLWNWPTSDLNLVKAVAFNPSYATAHHIRANFLAAVNRLPEARQAIDTAMELDPLSNIIKTARGSILLKNGQAEDAVAQYRAVLAEDPSFVNARNQLAGALVVLGRWDQALQESSLSVKTAKRASFALAQYGYLTAKIGSRSEAVAIVTELSSRYLQHQSQPSFVAQVLLGLGETAQAIVWLEKGVADMDPNLTGLRTGSMFSELHSYPEFQNLLTQLKL